VQRGGDIDHDTDCGLSQPSLKQRGVCAITIGTFSVTADGTGDASRARGLKTGRYLKKMGYSKVLIVGFLTAPGTALDTRP